MASIKISDLQPTNSGLFNNPKSYLDNLNEQEKLVSGGLSFFPSILALAKYYRKIRF